ncbi:DUF1542 domain-containing protein [uncultured Streptococcus sp.]|uniref:DUF1542 domain-containing protein n=1 Tax=uncultured Streptococcus sp. TaxID=83427 RepID=UPI0028D716A8|nr:DUF1542 domain-containing protein [uncultured Streptococcus sp.]
MENKSSMSRAERLRREKVTRYSIRKYSFGAASVAVAALFMFLGNGAVSANELSKQDTPSVETPAPASENKPTSVENTPVVQPSVEESTAKPEAAATPALDKTKLESYISEIKSKLASGKYANKTEESLALLNSKLASAESTLASATTQDELTKAYQKLVMFVSSGLKSKPKEAPKVDTTNGQPTVGKKAGNTENKSDSNSIENTGSKDPRNGKEMDKENAFRTEATAATHEATTNKVGNISYTMEFSDDAKKEIYLYNQEDTNIDITVNSTAGNISSVKVRGGGNRPLDEATKDSTVQIDGFGWSYTQTVTETAGPVTMNITGKTNERFLGLTPTNRREDQHSVLGARYLVITDAAGGKVEAPSNGSNQPGYFNLVVKSQTYKYDIKDLTEERRITVNDIDNITPTELASIKSRLKLEYSKKSNDARFVGGATVANPTSLIDTVAVSTTEPSKLVVTYKDGSVDTIEKSKVLNVKPAGIIPFSKPDTKEIYVYKGEETNLEFGVTDDSGKIKDLRIVQGSAIMGASGAEKGQVRNEYGLTMTSETNENGIVATTAHPAITRITGTVDVPGKPKFVGPLMTRYLVAEDLDGALFSNPDANKNMDQEGAFKLVVREQTQKYDIQGQTEEANKVAVSDVNNLSDADFEKIKNNIKIQYKTSDDERLKEKDGSLVENASQYIQSVTKEGDKIVVTYKDGSTDKLTLTEVVTLDKQPAIDAVNTAASEKIAAINATPNTTDEAKAAAIAKVNADKEKALTAINDANVTTKDALNQVQNNGTTAINNVTPIAKAAAKKAINDELTAKNTEIDNRQDLSQAEKTAAKAEAKKLADAQLAEIAKQPDVADTPAAATTAQQAVDAAGTKGVADVKSVNPLAKDAAKADIETARQNKVNDITNNNNLSQAEKDAAVAKVNKAAEDATKAVDAATTADALTTAKGDGTTAINNVTPVAKAAAKQAIADALNGKDGQKGKLQEIEERTDLTTEEKAAAKKEAQDKADAELAKINAQPDAADTPAAATTAQEAVDAAGTKGVADVKSVNPAAKAKPEAKKAIDDALTAKNNAIDARDDLTPEQKTALKNAAKAKADAAKDAIDKATTDADVDQAKTDGATAVANVTPVAKEPAKQAIAKALEDKNAEIDKRTDLTVEEKAKAKAEAKKLADAQLAEIAKQPDVADTLEAAQTAQTVVDAAKKTGVDEVTAVNPTAVTKPAAKKAIDDKLAKQLEDIANTPDATDEEKKVAEDAAKAAAEKAKEEIDKAGTDAAVEAKKDEAVGKDGAKGTIDKLPVVEDKPNARKAIEDEANAKKQAIDARQDLTPEAKEVLKAKVDKIAEKAKEGIDAVTSKTDVDVIKEADKAAIKAIGEINRPIDKVLVKDPSALTAEEKAKILEEVKKVNPTAKEVKYDDNGKIEVTTEAGDKGIIDPTKLVKTEEQLDNGKGGNDINKPLDKVIVKDPSKLTDEEKAKIVAEVEAVNPDAIVTIDENGTVSVSTPEGKTAAIPATDLVRTKEDTANPSAGNSKIVKPADKLVGNPTNPDDRAKVEEKLKELNPEAKSVVFDENGNATVTLKDGTSATIPEADLFKSEAYLAEPKAGNDVVKPADKTVVANPEQLTDAEKKAIEDKVKAVNPGATVVVDDKGNTLVTTPEGKTALIPAADLTKSAEDAAKPNAGDDIVKPADKTVVANPEQLTNAEKKAIEDKVKAVNPGATVAVDDKGNATVTLENGKTAVIPATNLTKSAEDAAKPNAGNDIVKPADKTVVANPEQLTDAEKKAIEDKVKAVNPGATVVVDDKGNATVTTPDGKTAVIPAKDLTKTAADAAKPKAGNDVNTPADKTVVANPEQLTDAEKEAVKKAVESVNPGSTVVVDDKGNATVTTPDGKTAVIPAKDLTKTAADAAKPKAGNDVNTPADKTVVANPEQLTDAEKKAIADKVKAVNPGAEVVVDDKGNATVTVNGKTAVIPVADLTKSAADAAKPNAGNDVVKPADKTLVKNPEQLSDEEKQVITDKLTALNPEAKVVVDDKGNATVTPKDGKPVVIPASDLTKTEAQAKEPKAGNDIVKPADKTVVANPDSLTQDEKDAIAAKVKAVNSGAEVVVDDKGNATVTLPNGKTAVIPASDLTKNADAEKAPKAGNDIVKPASKVLVKDPESLTKDEKDAIAAKVEAVNPGSTVVVDEKGNATVTTPEGKTAVIPASDLTKSEKDVNDGKAKDNAVTPAAKTKVANPNALTDAEKKVIEDKVKAANPGATVVVDDKGNATVVKDGNVSVIPSTDLVKVEDDAKKDNGGNDANTPAAKTVVADPTKLTDEEKAAVKKAVAAVNSGSTVVVDDKGNATVTKADGTVLNIPASDLVIPADNLADEATNAKVKTPAFRTLVGNKDNLTDDEKAAVKKVIEAVNPGATVVVDGKGNATVTMPDGSTATISKEQLVKDKEDAKAKNGGDNLEFDFSKVTVTDLKNITPEEKAKFQFMILGAITDVEEFDISSLEKTTDAEGNTVYASKDGKVKITIDKDGNATIEKDGKKELAISIDKDGNVTIVTKEGQVLAIPRDDAFKQRSYVSSNGGGNNGATNTEAKVDKAKLEGAIRQLDELIIKESAKLDAETAKEATALLAEAKAVFANADASQAEVDAMVKRIEDFMAKVSPSTDHATPANDQDAQTPANARKVAKELPNTGTADSTVAMVAAAASALLGLGLAGRRRKEDEEA